MLNIFICGIWKECSKINHDRKKTLAECSSYQLPGAAIKALKVAFFVHMQKEGNFSYQRKTKFNMSHLRTFLYILIFIEGEQWTEQTVHMCVYVWNKAESHVVVRAGMCVSSPLTAVTRLPLARKYTLVLFTTSFQGNEILFVDVEVNQIKWFSYIHHVIQSIVNGRYVLQSMCALEEKPPKNTHIY